jgi:hypothetical protein
MAPVPMVDGRMKGVHRQPLYSMVMKEMLMFSSRKKTKENDWQKNRSIKFRGNKKRENKRG